MMNTSLAFIYDGWTGYQTSILHAIEKLSAEQLMYKPAEDRRSIGELVRHIAMGRVTWFSRIHPPGFESVRSMVPKWETDREGNHHALESPLPADDASVLIHWLMLSWQPIQAVLDQWTMDDLKKTYRHRYFGVDYNVSYQWTIWRIMCHDIHHGGQIALILAMQGIEAFELRALGGHIVEPPKV